MRVDLDAKVFSIDGEELGSVQRAVMDPATSRIKDLVVSTGGLLGRDVLVPIDAVDTDASGDTVKLKLPRSEVERLPGFVEANFVPPPVGWVPPDDLGFAYGGYLWPAMYPSAAPVLSGTPATEPTSPTLAKGAVVLDMHGEDIGVVDDVRFDGSSGHLLGFDLRVGGVLATLFGGGQKVAVSRNQVDRITEGAIHLSIGKVDVQGMVRE